MPRRKEPSWYRDFDPERDVPTPGDQLQDGTVEQLAFGMLTKPPMGEYVFRQTREVALQGPFSGAHGRSHGQWVFHTRGEKQFVRAYTRPADPRSAFQLEQRHCMRLVQIGWQEMTAEERDGWDAFAATIPHLAGDTGKRGVQTQGHRASRLYNSAQLTRTSMGLPISNAVPNVKVTAHPMDIAVVPAPEPGQLGFRVFYTGRTTPGLRVLVEMTPGMKTERRRPLERELTRAATTSVGSFFPLAESGATYVLEQPRHALVSGQRFGMRVTLVSEEGLRSRPLFLQDLRAIPAQTATVMATSVPAGTSSTAQPGDMPRSACIRPLPPPGEPRPGQEETILRHRELFERLRQPPLESPHYRLQVKEHWERISGPTLQTRLVTDPRGSTCPSGGP